MALNMVGATEAGTIGAAAEAASVEAAAGAFFFFLGAGAGAPESSGAGMSQEELVAPEGDWYPGGGP